MGRGESEWASVRAAVRAPTPAVKAHEHLQNRAVNCTARQESAFFTHGSFTVKLWYALQDSLNKRLRLYIDSAICAGILMDVGRWSVFHYIPRYLSQEH